MIIFLTIIYLGIFAMGIHMAVSYGMLVLFTGLWMVSVAICWVGAMASTYLKKITNTLMYHEIREDEKLKK